MKRKAAAPSAPNDQIPEGQCEHGGKGGHHHAAGGEWGVAVVAGGKDGGGGAGGHPCHQDADAQRHAAQPQKGADAQRRGGQGHQPDKTDKQGVPADDGGQLHIRQNGPHDEHGHGGVAVSDVADRLRDHGGKVDLSEHPEQAQPDGHQAGVGQDVPQDLLFIDGGIRHEIGSPHGPHDDPQRDQKHGGVHHSRLAVDALGDGVAKKAAVGNDGAVLQDLLPLRRIAVVKPLVQQLLY